MKIHSSSLSLPVSPNLKVGKNSTAQNKDNNELFNPKKTAPQKIAQPSSPEAIKKTLATIKSETTANQDNNINKPTNSRAIKALSAYNQTINAPLHEQRAQLLSGIDTYA